MKRPKVLLLISVVYSIVITALFVVNGSNYQDRIEELSMNFLKQSDENIRIRSAMTDEFFQMQIKYEVRIDSLEQHILNSSLTKKR